MEIRKYLDIVGVVCTEAITEGRMVRLTARGTTGLKNFGGTADLPGVELPDTEAEANEAFYCVTWPVSNSDFGGGIRMIVPQPGEADETFALRRGFGGDADTDGAVPFAATAVHLTYPGHKDAVVIPAGFQALAFARGVFRVASGAYLNAGLGSSSTGAKLSVANTADDGAGSAGKLKLQDGSEVTVAYVEQLDADDGSLTFRTINP